MPSESESVNPTEGPGNEGDDESSESSVTIPEMANTPDDLNLQGTIVEVVDVPIKIVGPNNEEILPEDIIVAPDGGWGWVIVFASFMSNLIADGTLFSFGVLMDPIATSTKKNGTELLKVKTQVAWVGGMLGGFQLCAGPFVSSLANIFGFRITAIAGSITSFFGFLMGWALNQDVEKNGPNLDSLFGFVGFIGGVGFCLIYLPTVITVGYYFEKKRALATCIALCGSGMGTFVYAPLVNFLLEELGWAQTILVEGCLLLSCAFFAALYRPLKAVRQTLPADRKGSIGESFIALPTEDTAGITKVDPGESGINKDSIPATSVVDVPKEGAQGQTGDDQPDPPTNVPVNQLSVGGSESNLGAASSMKMSRRSVLSTTGTNITLLVDPSGINVDDVRVFRVSSIDTLNKPLHRPHIFHGGSIRRDNSTERMPSIEWEAVPVSASISGVLMAPPPKKTWCKFFTFTFPILRKMLDFSLLKSLTFVLLSCSGFLTFLGYYVPYAFIGAIMMEITKGTSSHAAILLSVIGASNTVGRVMCGLIANKMSSHLLLINNLALTVAGVSTGLVPFFNSYPIFIVYACVYGISLACFGSLRSSLVVQLMGIKKLTNAYGLLCLFQGTAAIMGGPLAGYLKEMTMGYNASFHVAGLFMLLSGVICYPLNHINRWEKNRTREKEIVKVQVL